MKTFSEYLTYDPKDVKKWMDSPNVKRLLNIDNADEVIDSEDSEENSDEYKEPDLLHS